MIQTSERVQRIAGSEVPVLFGEGASGNLAREVRALGSRVLVVTDPGIVGTGYVDLILRDLREAVLAAEVYAGVEENPTTRHVREGLEVAKGFGPEVLLGIGGGSAMDAAKGVNFLWSNGGEMKDYWGVGKAMKGMLPMVAVPTTAGTGSEAQSAALIADEMTHQKMACLDKKALPRLAVLDPALLVTCPRGVRVATGLDAVAHAVESAGTTKRNGVSRRFSAEAWRILRGAFGVFVEGEESAAERAEMMLGAHLAGCAIENSMLGAAHACANPLTEMFGVVHGVAVGVMLPAVVRFNGELGENPYEGLGLGTEALAREVEGMLAAAGMSGRLRDWGVKEEAIGELGVKAAMQWTARFNPRAVDAGALAGIYRAAF